MNKPRFEKLSLFFSVPKEFLQPSVSSVGDFFPFLFWQEMLILGGVGGWYSGGARAGNYVIRLWMYNIVSVFSRFIFGNQWYAVFIEAKLSSKQGNQAFENRCTIDQWLCVLNKLLMVLKFMQCGTITVNSHLVGSSLSWTPCYYKKDIEILAIISYCKVVHTIIDSPKVEIIRILQPLRMINTDH